MLTYLVFVLFISWLFYKSFMFLPDFGKPFLGAVVNPFIMDEGWLSSQRNHPCTIILLVGKDTRPCNNALQIRFIRGICGYCFLGGNILNRVTHLNILFPTLSKVSNFQLSTFQV